MKTTKIDVIAFPIFYIGIGAFFIIQGLKQPWPSLPAYLLLGFGAAALACGLVIIGIYFQQKENNGNN